MRHFSRSSYTFSATSPSAVLAVSLTLPELSSIESPYSSRLESLLEMNKEFLRRREVWTSD